MPAHEVGWPASRSWDQPSEPIVIGLVNNMPDAALPGTERQFRRLLPTACCETTVSVRLFAIPELHSPGTGVRQAYEDIGELWSSRLDGLIVTGREPRASALPDEPFWSTLTKLADWAQINTVSAIWSCLSAQAVVLHHHRIRRRPLGRKLYGVFDCHKTADHELTSTSPTSWRVAHSRLNEIPERDLVSNGYQILSRSPQAGADIFVRQSGSLFVFLQGHPEYGPATVLGEYRRDVGRFLAGKQETYPDMPSGCLDRVYQARLSDFRELALRARHPELLLHFPVAAQPSEPPPWQEHATTVFANWISYIARRRPTRRLSNESLVSGPVLTS